MSAPTSTSPALKFNKLFATSLANNLPVSAIMELTYDCNLKCKHCYIVRSRRPVVSTREALNILDQLAEMGTLFLTFTGGEALQRADFFDIAEYARHRNFALRVFTNGTLINARTADKIKKISPLAVGISIYSHRAAVHDAFTRTRGSFEKSTKAIQMLVKRNVKVELKCCVLKINKNDLNDIVQLGEKLGCAVKFDPMITPQNNGGEGPLKYAIDQSDLIDFFKKMAERSTVEDRRRVERDGATAFCRAGRDVVSISPFGDVFPCTALPAAFGNLRRAKLAEIWHSKGLQKFREQSIIANVKKCRECDLLCFCSHCIGVDYVENKSLKRPSRINCNVASACMQAGRASVN